MHFHHRDPATKIFKISEGAYRQSRAKILAEIEKCDLLCGDCHRAEHRPKCGTNSAYSAGCHCEKCRAAHATYVRERRRLVADPGAAPGEGGV